MPTSPSETERKPFRLFPRWLSGRTRVWKWCHRGLATLVVVFLLLIVIGLVRTLRFDSQQPDVAESPKVEIDTERAVERFAGSLRFQTIAAPNRFDTKAFLDLHEYLKSQFPRVHQSLEREVVGNYSLLYRWPGKDSSAKPILLMSHLDVVPVPALEAPRWKYNPWAGTVAEGFVWGRGALDVKGGMVSMLEATEHLLEHGFQPVCDVYFAFGHDEEILGDHGNLQMALGFRSRGIHFRFVLDEGGVIVKDVISGLEAPMALVAIAERGYANLKLIVRLKEAGHASMPPQQTAIGILGQAIAKIEKSPMPASLKGPAGWMLDSIGPEMSFSNRFVLANRDVLNPLILWQFGQKPSLNAVIRSTMATTMIRSGEAPNVMPSDAEATINVRIRPGDTPESILEHARQVIGDERVLCQLEPNPQPPSEVSDPDSSDFRLIQRTIRQLDPSIVVAPGLAVVATDSRHYEGLTENTFRFLPLRLGPDDLSRIHGIDERISVENYLEMVQFMVHLLKNAAE